MSCVRWLTKRFFNTPADGFEFARRDNEQMVQIIFIPDQAMVDRLRLFGSAPIPSGVPFIPPNFSGECDVTRWTWRFPETATAANFVDILYSIKIDE